MPERRHFTNHPSELRAHAKQPEVLRIPPEKKPETTYPCGKKEMDVIHCPDCLDHFSECAAKSREAIHENVMAYMEIKNRIAQDDAEKKQRLQQRKKCKRLARSMLKKREQIAQMRKELSQIYYNDGRDSAFTYAERGSGKNDLIEKALREGA